jgi:hypothetical protein
MWRNQKNWKERIPIADESAMIAFREALARGSCYVTIKEEVEIADERLYGVEASDKPEFWTMIDHAEVHAVKAVSIGMGTPEVGQTLLVIDELNAEPYAQAIYYRIPACDCVPATEATQIYIAEQLRERARRAQLSIDLQRLPRAFYDKQSYGIARAQRILSELPSIARVAYTADVKSIPPVTRTALNELMMFWDRVELLPIEDSTQEYAFLALTKHNLIMKYHSENTGRIHKSFDGLSIDMGRVVLELCYSVKEQMFPDIMNYELGFKVYGQQIAQLGYIHPHITRTNRTKYGLFEGECCLGSYSQTINDFEESFNMMGLIRVMQDYLCSCSESGWYNNFMPWLPQSIKEKYCNCGRVLKSEDEFCGGCGYRPPESEGTYVTSTTA